MELKMVKRFFLWMALVFTLPTLGMDDDNIQSDIPDEFKASLDKKHRITKENFDKAINAVKDRDKGEFMADKLSLKLHIFIDKELSTNEWTNEVHKAYQEIIKALPEFPARAVIMAHPFEEILFASMWAIPS
jgi:hypothetical protein